MDRSQRQVNTRKRIQITILFTKSADFSRARKSPLWRAPVACVRARESKLDTVSKLWNAHTHSFDRNPAGTSRFFFFSVEPSSVPSILKYAKLLSAVSPRPARRPPPTAGAPFRVRWIRNLSKQPCVCRTCVRMLFYTMLMKIFNVGHLYL